MANSKYPGPTDDKEQAVLEVIQQVFQQFTPSQVILSFNGGKDCTILLHMLDSYFRRTEELRETPLRVLYIQSDDTFDEIEQFVQQCTETYHIELIRREGSIKDVLRDVCQEMPELKAVFLGSRRTDPYCENLHVMQKTDPGWPELLRISPILDWTCKDVWHYIRSQQLPYCRLYDEGYTSLGNKSNTKPNPHLRRVDATTGAVSYGPANEMEDDALERAGRG